MSPRQPPWLPVGLSGVMLLSGCAAAGRPAPAPRDVEPDCSFRSATTCWTVEGRFPPRRPAADAPPPGGVFDRPPAAIAATATDTGAGPRPETREEPAWAAQPRRN